MFLLALLAAVQVCLVASKDASQLPCPLIMCPQCPDGFHTERPWTKDIDCSLISCKCIPDVLNPPKKICPLISCPGRFGKCKRVDGCDLCECLPVCPPLPPTCPKNCYRRKRMGCSSCHCPVRPPMCPLVMCAMYCKNGFEADENGCSVCKCRKCPLGMCRMYCKHGFEVDKNGCKLCKCKKCPLQMCARHCRFGFQVGKDGCNICKCNRVPIELKPPKIGAPGSSGAPGPRG